MRPDLITLHSTVNGAVFCAIVFNIVFKKEGFMFSITANELKRNGVAGIERVMLDNNETGVTVDVRGKAKYVILSVDEFNQYREYQLDQAIAEAEACLVKGEYNTIEDLENYAQALEKEIANDI